VTVTCPGCKKRLNVPDSAVGKTVACPACKSPVKVEEKLEIMLDGASPPPAAGGPAKTAVGAPPSACANCGFPLLPTMKVCNRCGTNRFTGARDQSGAGYQAGAFKKMLGKSGPILTLLIAGGIAFGIYMGVTRSREWARKTASDDKPTNAKQGPGRRNTGQSQTATSAAKKPTTRKPTAKKPTAKKPTAEKPAPEKPGGAKPETAAETPPADNREREEKLAERFEEAFALLMDPLPKSQKNGRRLLARLGKDAAPLVARRLSESADPAVRLVMVKTLARLKFPTSAARMAEVLGDADDNVREAAIAGLASSSSAAVGPLCGALASEDDRVRCAAIRVAEQASITRLAPNIVDLLSVSSPRVRWQAAKGLRGQMATKEAHPKLVAALDDEVLDVAVAAAKSLAGQHEAMPLVMARFEKLPADGNTPEAVRSLCLLATPILASQDAGARTKLAERLCASRPELEVVETAKRLLATTSTRTRARTMTALREDGDDEPPMPLIVGVGLMDGEARIRRAALDYFAAFPREDMLFPVIIVMGDDDLKLAMSAALGIGRLDDNITVEALRQVVKGVAPLRTVMAAGALARKKDRSGEKLLMKAFARELGLPSPIPAWAAYQLSFIGNKELAKRFVAEAETAGSSEERAYYIAAAARLGNEGSRKQLVSVLSDRRTQADIRVETAQVLSEDDPEEGRKALVNTLSEREPTIQMAALKALADMGDPKAITGILKRIPRFTPAAAKIAKATIVGFGKRAEDPLVSALSSVDQLERAAALEALTTLGKQTSRDGIKAVLRTMRVHENDPVVTRLAAGALVAMTGRSGNPAWTWKEWARALGFRSAFAKVAGEERFGWISFKMPQKYTRQGWGATTNVWPYQAIIKVRTERDPPGPKHLYENASAMREARLRELTLTKDKGRLVRLPGMFVTKCREFTVSTGDEKAQISTLRLTNSKKRRTTYYYFLINSAENGNRYAEIECFTPSSDYNKESTFFEKKLSQSLKIRVDELE